MKSEATEREADAALVDSILATASSFDRTQDERDLDVALMLSLLLYK
jgi:hypothetical protein